MPSSKPFGEVVQILRCRGFQGELGTRAARCLCKLLPTHLLYVGITIQRYVAEAVYVVQQVFPACLLCSMEVDKSNLLLRLKILSTK